MEHNIGADAKVGGGAAASGIEVVQFKITTLYEFEAFDPDGNLLWTESARNLVTTAGLNKLLQETFKGSAYTAAWYVGLVDGGTSPLPSYAAGDTMASHAGWTELTTYAPSPNVRPTLTLGTVAAGSVDNSASKASFVMANASPDSISIAGAFIADESTIGGGSPAGTLYSVANFTGGTKALNNGDTLNVTCTLTATSA